MITQNTMNRKRAFVNQLSILRQNAARAAERERNAAKAGNAPNAETDKTSQKEWFNNYGIITTRYLKEVYSINTIKGLAHQLNLANSKHDSVEKSINLYFRTIDCIVESCEKWRKYLADQESFDLLVCLEVISMAKIHTSVIAARNFHERQGARGVHIKNDVSIPYLFTTVVSYHGTLQVFS